MANPIILGTDGNYYEISYDQGSLVTIQVPPPPPPTPPVLVQGSIPVPNTSAADFSAAALRLLGVIDPGEQPTAGELDDCLSALNMMMDSWQADNLMIFTRQIQDFPLVNSKQLYTMGPGGDFNINRPADIGNQASIIIRPNSTQPIEYVIPLYTMQDWQGKVPVKSVQGNLPLLAYDDGDFPLRSISFWPIPGDTLNVRFYLPQLLSTFIDLYTKYSFPPGYAECIKYNLAIRVAPEFGTSASAEVAVMAATSIATVKLSNPDDTQLHSDIGTDAMTGSRFRAEWFGIPSF